MHLAAAVSLLDSRVSGVVPCHICAHPLDRFPQARDCVSQLELMLFILKQMINEISIIYTDKQYICMYYMCRLERHRNLVTLRVLTDVMESM